MGSAASKKINTVVKENTIIKGFSGPSKSSNSSPLILPLRVVENAKAFFSSSQNTGTENKSSKSSSTLVPDDLQNQFEIPKEQSHAVSEIHEQKQSAPALPQRISVVSLNDSQTAEAEGNIRRKLEHLSDTFSAAKQAFANDGFNSEKLTQLLETLDSFMALPENSPLRRRWIESLNHAGLVETWFDWWPEIWQQSFVEPQHDDVPHLGTWRTNFTYWLRLLWNTTAECPSVCYQVLQRRGLRLILEKLDSKVFEPYTLGENQRKRYYLSALLSTIYNCLTTCTGGPTTFRKMNGVQTLSRFFRSPSAIIKTKTVFCLALACDELPASITILVAAPNLQLLKQLFQESVSNFNKQQQIKFRSNSGNWTAYDVVRATNCVTVFDEGRSKLIKLGILPLYTNLLSKTYTQEIELGILVLEGLWLLCFDSEAKSKLKDNASTTTLLNDLKTHSNLYVSRAVDGILWTMKQKSALFQTPHNAKQHHNHNNKLDRSRSGKRRPSSITRKHIFISYESGTQLGAVQIRDELNHLGQDTWMDNAMKMEYAVTLHKVIFSLTVQKDYVPDGWLKTLGSGKENRYFLLESPLKAAANIVEQLAEVKAQKMQRKVDME